MLIAAHSANSALRPRAPAYRWLLAKEFSPTALHRAYAWISVDESGSNVLNDAFPAPRRTLVEQSSAAIPDRGRAAGWPAPVAIRVQHNPGFVTERSGQVYHHAVDADDEIQFRHAVTERHDIRRADILGADFGSRISSGSSLQ